MEKDWPAGHRHHCRLNMLLPTRAPGKALGDAGAGCSPLAGVAPMAVGSCPNWAVQSGRRRGLDRLVCGQLLSPPASGAYYNLRIVFLMYFGAEGDDRLDEGKSRPVVRSCCFAAAVIMVVGIVNLFGVETAAISAARRWSIDLGWHPAGQPQAPH